MSASYHEALVFPRLICRPILEGEEENALCSGGPLAFATFLPCLFEMGSQIYIANTSYGWKIPCPNEISLLTKTEHSTARWYRLPITVDNLAFQVISCCPL